MFPISYRRHRFPPTLIQHAVWLYLRFTLSYRDVEELLAQRGLALSCESVRFSIAARVKLRPDYLMPSPFSAPANDATRGSCFSSRSAQAAS